MRNAVKPLRWASRWVSYLNEAAHDFATHLQYSKLMDRPLSQRVVEQARLLIISGVTAEDYYNHGLFRKEMPFQEKCAFLGYFDKTRYFDAINPPVYDILARDKVLSHMLLSSFRLPVPELLAVIGVAGKPHFGRTLSTIEDFTTFLQEPESENIFLKPAGSSFGEGALSLGLRVCAHEWESLPTRTHIRIEDIKAHVTLNGKLRRFLVQKRLEPHARLAAIVPDVCSTVRLMTHTHEAKVSIVGATLRLGSGREPTDNLSGGGVVASLDLEAGLLRDVVSIDRGVPERMSAHPVTGAQVSGVSLPYWHDILEMIQTAATQLSFIPLIGWDIAITVKGPVIVEINTRPRARPIQVANGQGVLSGSFRDALRAKNGTLNSGLHIR